MPVMSLDEELLNDKVVQANSPSSNRKLDIWVMRYTGKKG